MADIVDRATRSRIMSRIRGADTGPERLLRRALHRLGLRYRLRPRHLPGRPDLVFPKYRAAVFVHGCFWHRHPGCPWAYEPKSNVEFWRRKFEENVERDRRVMAELRRRGWRVAVVWECALRRADPETVARQLAEWLAGEGKELEIPQPSDPVSHPSGSP